MLGAALSLVARHVGAPHLLLAFVAAPLLALLSPGGAPPPLQSVCGLALMLLEIVRHLGGEEVLLSAVAVGLFLLAARGAPPRAPLALALASACVVVSAPEKAPEPQLLPALLALDFAAAYVGDAWHLLLLLAPLAVLRVLRGGVDAARWGLLPALWLGAHAHAHALRREGPTTLYAIVAATALALCAQNDPFLELALFALHAGARWLAPVE